MTDTHAQLRPVYFREPSVNLGVGAMQGKPPHLVGRAFLDRFGIQPDSADAYAFTCLDFEKAAARFGKLGGFAHLKTLIDRLRGEAGPGRSLLLDGGDLWQGTGLANTMQGADMVEAANLLGIEAMTGHWEFTYGEKALRATSNASRASSWRRTSFSPRRPPSTTPRRSIRPRGACSSPPPSRRSAGIASP